MIEVNNQIDEKDLKVFGQNDQANKQQQIELSKQDESKANIEQSKIKEEKNINNLNEQDETTEIKQSTSQQQYTLQENLDQSNKLQSDSLVIENVKDNSIEDKKEKNDDNMKNIFLHNEITIANKSNDKIKVPQNYEDSNQFANSQSDVSLLKINLRKKEKKVYQKKNYNEKQAEKQKQSLNRYQDLIKCVKSCEKVLWSDKINNQNKKLLTGATFWFYISAIYFPRFFLYDKSINEHINDLKMKLEKMAPTAKLRITSAQSELFLKSSSNQSAPQLNHQQGDGFTELKRIKTQINELLSKNKISYQTCQSDKAQEPQCIYKSLYTTEDDLYIIKIRKLLLQLYDNYLKQEDYKIGDYDIILSQMKDLDLDLIINLMEIRLQDLHQENFKLIDSMQERASEDINNYTKVFKKSEFNFDDILVDIFFLNETEKQYLNRLEVLQQEELINKNDFYAEPLAQKETKENSTPQNLEEKQSGKQKSIHKQDRNPKYVINQLTIRKEEEKKNYDDEEEEEEDVKCAICSDGNWSDDNHIVFCSKCNIPVHQRCYGIPKVPEGDWICELCIAFGPYGRYLRCPLCSCRGGAMKQSKLSVDSHIFKDINPDYHQFQKQCSAIKNRLKKQIYTEQPEIQNNLKEEQEDSEDQLYYDFLKPNEQILTPEQIQSIEPKPYYIWAHVSCTLWTPECYFEDKMTYNYVKGIEQINKKRFKLTCQICHKEKSGSCIICPRQKCQTAFHPECARRSNLYMEIKTQDNSNYQIYCQQHIPLLIRKQIDQLEKKYKEEIYKFCKLIEKYSESIIIQKKKSKKIFKLKENQKKIIKQERENDDQTFIQFIEEYFKSEQYLNFFITLSKDQNSKYHIQHIQKPKAYNDSSLISKEDNIWQTIQYKSLPPIKLFSKYKKLFLKQRTQFLKIYDKVRERIIEEKAKALEQKKQTRLKKLIKRTISSKQDIKPTKKHLKQKKKQKYIEQSIIKQFYSEQPQQQIDNKLYCICQKPYQDGELMMQCEKCDEWYHFSCIGFQGTIDQADELQYVCDKCNILDDIDMQTKRKLDYQAFFRKQPKQKLEEEKCANSTLITENTTQAQPQEHNPLTLEKNDCIKQESQISQVEVHKSEKQPQEKSQSSELGKCSKEPEIKNEEQTTFQQKSLQEETSQISQDGKRNEPKMEIEILEQHNNIDQKQLSLKQQQFQNNQTSIPEPPQNESTKNHIYNKEEFDLNLQQTIKMKEFDTNVPSTTTFILEKNESKITEMMPDLQTKQKEGTKSSHSHQLETDCNDTNNNQNELNSENNSMQINKQANQNSLEQREKSNTIDQQFRQFSKQLQITNFFKMKSCQNQLNQVQSKK